MPELVKGRASCHKTLLATYIQMAVLPKVRSALRAASQLPTDVDALAPACLSKPDDDDG